MRLGSRTAVETGMVLAVEVASYFYGQSNREPEDNLVVGADANTLLTQAVAQIS